MAAETPVDFRAAVGLARLAASDLSGRAALALEGLAQAQDLADLVAEDSTGLPLLGEDPFSGLSGQEPGVGEARISVPARGGHPPAGTGLLRRLVGASVLAGRREGTTTKPTAGRETASRARAVPAAEWPGVADAAPGTSLSTPSRARGSTSEPPETASRPLDRVVAAVAGKERIRGFPSAPFPTSTGERRAPAVEHAAQGDVSDLGGGVRPFVSPPVSTPSVPNPAAEQPLLDRSLSSNGGPADVPGGGSGGGEGEPRAEATSTVRFGGLWSQLAELAEEALRGGGGSGQTGGVSVRNPEEGAARATDEAVGGPGGGPVPPETETRGAMASLGSGETFVRAARARATELLDKPQTASSERLPVEGQPRGSASQLPDPDELAALVNDALVRQARRHGVDLS